MHQPYDGGERAQLTQALMYLNREAMRLPLHFVDRRAALHARINELLTLLEMCD